MKKALVVGGNSGIGLSLTGKLLENNDIVYVIGKDEIDYSAMPAETKKLFKEKTVFYKLNLNDEKYDIFDNIQDIDTLIITAGFGRVALFENLTETEIKNLIKCNALSVIQILKKYYSSIKSDKDFKCAVMVSIAGHLSSPYMSVYGAAKASAASFIESLNAELSAEGYSNRVLDVSPGSIKGTAFYGSKTDLSQIEHLSDEIIARMNNKDVLFIPKYDEIFRDVLKQYHDNPEAYGIHSYQYKKDSGRISDKPQVVKGFLSGTFDLFHIGHLNLLRKAKEQCDYLIVAVHKSGKWKGKQTFIPYEERRAIVESICYVDEVVDDYSEDIDSWPELHYDKLFVGSDYKGSERFNRYEEYFSDKNVEIVYFPYTKGTSSTQLREALVSGVKNSNS